MIGFIRGKLLLRRPEHIVVDVGGVGYRVFLSLRSFCRLPGEGEEVGLIIHTVVREDAIHLYGFLEQEEWETFGQLLGVKGVGPKLALGILSAVAPGELWDAVRRGDTAALGRIPGVGKKTAAQLVVDLAGRLPPGERDSGAGESVNPVLEDATSALVNLGYPETKARAAVQQVAKGMQAPVLEELIRLALKALAQV